MATEGTSENAHTKLLGVVEQLLTRRAEVLEKCGAYPFFWDFMKPKEAKSLDEVFEKDLARTPIYEELQGVISKEHKFCDWLPHKVRLSFLSSFERDTRLLYKSRIDAFSQAAAGCKYRSQMAKDTVNGIKAVTDNSSGSSK